MLLQTGWSWTAAAAAGANCSTECFAAGAGGTPDSLVLFLALAVFGE